MKGVRILPAPRATFFNEDGPCKYRDITLEQAIAVEELVAEKSPDKGVRQRARRRAEGLKSGDIPWPPP